MKKEVTDMKRGRWVLTAILLLVIFAVLHDGTGPGRLRQLYAKAEQAISAGHPAALQAGYPSRVEPVDFVIDPPEFRIDYLPALLTGNGELKKLGTDDTESTEGNDAATDADTGSGSSGRPDGWNPLIPVDYADRSWIPDEALAFNTRPMTGGASGGTSGGGSGGGVAGGSSPPPLIDSPQAADSGPGGTGGNQNQPGISVPEPADLLLVISGLLGLAAMGRKLL